jgi:hypothetical protein
VGNDLFGTHGTAPFAPAPDAGMALYDHVVAREGAVARLSSETPMYLRWADAGMLRLEPIDGAPPPELKARALRERGYVALLDWQTRMQALHRKPGAPPCPSS